MSVTRSLAYSAIIVAATLIGGLTHASGNSLYERLGGKDNVDSIANDLIDRTTSDPNLKRSFAKSDLKHIKRLLAEQICALTGGPCTYSGDTMKEVHAGLNIRQDEFYGMVEIFSNVMIQHGVALPERNEVLALFAPMKRDVVTR